MRVRVITACLLLLTASLAGCISDLTDEENSDTIEDVTESVEVLGCMDQTALNYDEDATNDSKLCLSIEQLIQAEDLFWSSWDRDAIDNLTEPVGYRLMVDESITWGDGGENITNHSMVVQEVFAPDYYDQKIEYKVSDEYILDDVIETSHYSSQTVFDNAVQVENFNDGEWDNYSMETASTYNEFRDNLEHGPGIRSYNGVDISSESSARSENITSFDDENDGFQGAMGFPNLDQVEFEEVLSHVIETSSEGENSQLIYYLAKNTTTNTHVEIMGKMTEDGFKITEYCNNRMNNGSEGQIATSDGFIYQFFNDNESDEVSSVITSFRIILLESVGSELRFGEFEFTEPVNSRGGNASTSCSDTMRPCLAIPFYFETIWDDPSPPPVAEVDAENTTARGEGRKGLNAVNVKVVIAGPSGPYGMEGSLDDYFLVLSNCTIDNLTLYGSDADAAISQEASARSENDAQAIDRSSVKRSMFGSDGNSCSSEVKVSLRDIADVTEGESSDIDSFAEIVAFIDSDSSGTLSEGDRFEFGDNFTALCDGLDDDCDGFNMLRLYSKSAEKYSDENIDLTDTTRAAVHDTAMNSIRTVRAVAADDSMPFLDSVRTAVDHNSARSNRESG